MLLQTAQHTLKEIENGIKIEVGKTILFNIRLAFNRESCVIR